MAAPDPLNRPSWREALSCAMVLDRLARFDPHVVGTPPLGIDLPGSDIDIVCHAPDAADFAQAVWQACAGHDDFSIHQWRAPPRPVIATFNLLGWPFEIYAESRPVREQHGWRHFDVERRLLALGGEPLRMAVMRARRAGLKTEPAFAAVLGLEGDPYVELLELEALEDAALSDLMKPPR